MLIHIMYPDNKYDFVREFMLGSLIEDGKVLKFRRSNGWVSVGEEPVRLEKPHYHYYGSEKRSIAVSHPFKHI